MNYENNILTSGCIAMDEYKVNIEDGEITNAEKGKCQSISLTACDSINFNPSPEEWFNFDSSTGTITGFSNSWNGTTDITIPCKIGETAVVSIGNGAFVGKNLISVNLNDNIIKIEEIAFVGNSIKKLKIGNNVVEIGPNSFNGNSLTELIIPDSVTTIGYAAFQDNELTNLILGDGLVEIGNGVFANNNLTTVIIPPNVTTIGASAFPKLTYSGLTNPNLTTIYNNTGKQFDWGLIINGESGYNFETVVVENSAGNVEITKSN